MNHMHESDQGKAENLQSTQSTELLVLEETTTAQTVPEVKSVESEAGVYFLHENYS